MLCEEHSKLTRLTTKSEIDRSYLWNPLSMVATWRARSPGKCKYWTTVVVPTSMMAWFGWVSRNLRALAGNSAQRTLSKSERRLARKSSGWAGRDRVLEGADSDQVGNLARACREQEGLLGVEEPGRQADGKVDALVIEIERRQVAKGGG